MTPTTTFGPSHLVPQRPTETTSLSPGREPVTLVQRGAISRLARRRATHSQAAAYCVPAASRPCWRELGRQQRFIPNRLDG